MKYKFLLIIALLFIYASSCDEDDPIEPFDHAAQALMDNDSLIKYMSHHYVDTDGIIKMISDGEQPIYDLDNPDPKLEEKTITRYTEDEEIELTLYYYTIEPGVNLKPTKVDLAYVAYKGFFFNSYNDENGDLVYEEEVFDQNDWGKWVDIYGIDTEKDLISGIDEGLVHFKSGIEIDPPPTDGSSLYDNTGEGYLFIPSGLAYSNIGKGIVLPNTPLIFKIELNEVFRTDHDEDTILSMFEDLDEDLDYSNDDTDEDGTRNMYDNDDDGDGILTKDENPDPNGDGNPEDALDTDGDEIPDYLDDDN